MIHYTLLPEKEMRALKREYRTRVFVMLLLFISCGVILGIISLFPACILSYSQGRNSLAKIQKLEKSREERGIDTILQELSNNSQILKKLQSDEPISLYSETITRISKHRTNEISINSFQIVKKQASTTQYLDATVQGKASTREALLGFKKSLESEEGVIKVDLPVSDLAKSKNISFSMKLSISKKITQ